MNDLFDFSLSRKEFFARFFWSVWKGSVLSALYFLVIWPIAIACVARESSFLFPRTRLELIRF